ncbi:MAG: hypothetical protein HZC12_10910 [Nitrospirae bacterium]|nr:hypothetical protein [Nitrospirota bacterium]
MIDQTEKGTLEKGMFTLRVIWIAMLVSLGFYVIIANYVAEKMPSIFRGYPVAYFPYILYAISAVELLIIRYIRKAVLSPQRISKMSGLTPPASVSSQQRAIAIYTQASIITWAIAESISVYGLVCFLLAEDYRSFYGLVIAAFMTIYFYRPKMEELTELLKAFSASSKA